MSQSFTSSSLILPPHPDQYPFGEPDPDIGYQYGIWHVENSATNSGPRTVVEISAASVGTYTGLTIMGWAVAGSNQSAGDPQQGDFSAYISFNNPGYGVDPPPITSTTANLEIWRETGQNNYRLVMDMGQHKACTVKWWRHYTVSSTPVYTTPGNSAALSDMTGWTAVVVG